MIIYKCDAVFDGAAQVLHLDSFNWGNFDLKLDTYNSIGRGITIYF